MTPIDPFDPEEFRQQGHQLVDALAEFLQQSVVTSTTANSSTHHVLNFREENDVYAEWKSVRPGELGLQELFSKVMEQSIRLHHPRFMGHQISPPSTAAALSGLVSDLLNNGMGVYEMGMAGTALERVVVELAADQFGFGDSAGGCLTSGGSLGNLTALLTARNTKADASSDAAPAVLVSEQAHYCVQRSVSLMGWGNEGLITVPTNKKFQMDVGCLAERLQFAADNNRQVVAVVGSACSTATGSYDDLKSIGEFCRQHDLWFHVDGAHGAAAAFSGKYCGLLDGIELADSVVLDFHKLLLTPALATALVFRDGSNGYRTFAQKADYLFSADGHDTQWHNLALRTFECTKLMMSLKIYSVYSQYGLQAWDDNVTTLYDLAATFADLIQANPRFELLVPPQSNIVCYRFLADEESQSNDVNLRIRDRIVRDGKFYIVQTNIDGTQWLRSTLGSATTTQQDLEALLDEVVRLGIEELP